MTLTQRVFLLSVICAFGSASAGVRVRHRLVNNNLEVFFLKDFDTTRPASGPVLFFVDVINDDRESHSVILSIQVESGRHGILSRGETLPFDLHGGEILTLSNRNLFSNDDPHRLDSYEVAENVVQALLKDILATGKLPTDVYTFRLQVRSLGQTLGEDNDSFDVRISNPQKLDLVFPGRPATGRRDCPEIYTALPQFRWESEMRRFKVIVAEARRGEDPESVLNQQPRFVRVFILDARGTGGVVTDPNLGSERVEFIPSTSFQYPASGEILTLRPGKTYYWRVEGIVETSSGPVALQSEIYCFKLARLDQLGGRKQQLEFLLRNILGSDYEQIFGEGGELEDYSPQRITFNGETVTFAELLRRLNKLSSHYQGYRIE